MKKVARLLAVATFFITSQIAEAGQPGELFAFDLPLQVQGGQAIAPDFTTPGVRWIEDYLSRDRYIKGLRIPGVVDMMGVYQSRTLSKPNTAGQVRLTQTCATKFRNPITGALIYQTPGLSLVSDLYDPQEISMRSGCNALPINQSRDFLGLLCEVVWLDDAGPLKLRVMDMRTNAARWTVVVDAVLGRFNSAVSSEKAILGSLGFGEVVDVNNDGTDELILNYYKDITPANGFNGFKIEITRQVRNAATGRVMAQNSFIEIFDAAR